MESNLAISVGSIIAFVSFFYVFLKDSKQHAEEMANLKARVSSLESRSETSEQALSQLLSSVQEIKVSLAKIDTKLSLFENEFNRDKNKS